MSLLITETLKTAVIPNTSWLLVLIVFKTIPLVSEKEQQLKKAKFLSKGNFEILKQKAEVEKLSDKLQSAKGK